MTYSERLRHPLWQKKRLQILERDGWKCLCCLSTTKNLQVHHTVYIKGLSPWEYPDEDYQTLCCDCHEARQELIDGAVNQLRRRMNKLPTWELADACSYRTNGNGKIDETEEEADERMFKKHFLSTASEAYDKSKDSKSVLNNGLFSDLLMELCYTVIGDGDGQICQRAIRLMSMAEDKLEGRK